MKITNGEQLIGNTPLKRCDTLQQTLGFKANLYAKLELFNQTGSVKDRAALYMIKDAEERGLLKEGSTIIEPTSGNTGIGLSAIGKARGYRVIIVMPDTMSKERRALMKAYGAELVLSPGHLGMKGAIEAAENLAATIPGSFIPDQFSNPANARAHYETTGPELFQDLDGQIDAVVAGVGTGGTITGIARYLKEQGCNARIIAAEPDSSAVLSGEPAGPHMIQGIGAGFIPGVLDVSLLDEIIRVKNEDAFAQARNFGMLENVLVGISSGAALTAAIEAAGRKEFEGKNIVVILPDSGDRYLSTPLFEDRSHG
ncbi:MAG: cysteine synthase A [Solobacterium sp.]|nr:cysteine synthase A [Solobacterium sp.]